jgi:hypothetical protein
MTLRLAFLAILALVLGAVAPSSALAHASERAFILLLPTGIYLAAGTIIVAATFLFLALASPRHVHRLLEARLPLATLPAVGATIPSCVSFIVLVALIAIGLKGPPGPLENPLPTTVWTLFWVGFVLLQAIAGNLWALVNPWVGPFRVARRLLGARDGLLPYPQSLGYAPAAAVFLGFAWLEIVDIAPSDPARLATVLLLYAATTFLGMALFGEKAWLSQAEALTVFLGFVARLSPLRDEGNRLSLAVPGAGLMRHSPLPASGILLVLLTLASVTFDGLCHTHTWLAAAGINPLEFPGRSAVTGINTVGLIGAWLLLSSLYGLAVVAGRPPRAREAAGLLVLSILPISIGYHFAHYLTALLVNSQQALAAYTDLLGLGHIHVTTSFLNDYYAVRLIWNVQAGAIILCHMLAFLVAHALVTRETQSRREAFLAGLPLAILMTGYTLLGLWLLAAPAVS